MQTNVLRQNKAGYNTQKYYSPITKLLYNRKVPSQPQLSLAEQEREEDLILKNYSSPSQDSSSCK